MPAKTTQRQQPSGPIHFINQVALILVGALVYFGVRGITEGSPSEAEALAERIFEFEQRIGLDLERGAQALVIDSATLTTLANWVYIWFHWPVIIATLIYLHRKHRSEYFTLRTALFASGLIGMIIFALFPVAPPRLLNEGFVDTVSDLSSSYRVLQPPALVNKYAALPSLHVGWNLLVAISVYRVSTRRILQVLAPLSVLAIVLAVVITGNHWVVDAIAGSAHKVTTAVEPLPVASDETGGGETGAMQIAMRKPNATDIQLTRNPYRHRLPKRVKNIEF